MERRRIAIICTYLYNEHRDYNFTTQKHNRESLLISSRGAVCHVERISRNRKWGIFRKSKAGNGSAKFYDSHDFGRLGGFSWGLPFLAFRRMSFLKKTPRARRYCSPWARALSKLYLRPQKRNAGMRPNFAKGAPEAPGRFDFRPIGGIFARRPCIC